ncbi:hypothetical protein JXA12_03240 [Candidatus Woesearchaeota archaeon]|nr:hypothetical protein [Candidatus Woesearchaeota archaeon]
MRISGAWHVLSLLCAAILLPALAAAEGPRITISEEGKIISFYDQYYVYQLNGTLEISNPSNTSLYNIDIPLYVSTLDIRTNTSDPENYLSATELHLVSLGPLSSRTFEYRAAGISTEDLSPNGGSVLHNGIEMLQPRIYSNLMGTLKKADFEDEVITGNPNTRLISVELSNPTGFDYTVAKVEVIKTAMMDPNAEIDRWSFTGQKPNLDPHEGWSFDFHDMNATEGEIYWLSTDIYIDHVTINATANISRFDEEDLFVVASNVTLNESYADNLSLLADRIYLRKLVSSSLVVPGDVVNVTVVVNNLEPEEVDLFVTDIIPHGFDVLSVEGGEVTGDNISWDFTLSSASAKRLRYQLRYDDPDSLGLDYFRPAQLVYDGRTYYSQAIPFVRKYIPEKRVFVQKKVRFLGDEEVQVTISLKNLGESSLDNLMVKEFLLENAEFREITQLPSERGLWSVESLGYGQEWSTSYITDRMSALNTLPEIYGVPRSSVLQSIILSNEVSSKLSLISTVAAEVAAIVILAIILVLYFLPANVFSRARREQSRDLRLMAKEIDVLRERTDRHNRSLRREHSSSALRPPSSEGSRESSLRSPERLARHAALERSAERLEVVKEKSAADKEERVRSGEGVDERVSDDFPREE